MIDKKFKIYTDSKITLDKLQNTKIHTYTIEEIRRNIIEMTRPSWEITFCLVKAHAGRIGNELPETVPKKATTNLPLTEDYNRKPKSVVSRDRRKNVKK